MDPFWIALIGGFLIYRVYKWDQSNKIRNEYDRVRKLRDSYSDAATEEHPELVGKYWNPNRSPVPSTLRPQILARTEGFCFYCNQDLNIKKYWQVDHIWPYRFGGSEELINLVPSCKSCNEKKWSHLPPRFLLYKWAVNIQFTEHELRLIEYFRSHSMAELIGTSAHWKGQANYWLDHVYADFADLITLNESVRGATGKRREELLEKANLILKRLDCDIAMRRYSTSRTIEKWIDDEQFLESLEGDADKDN